MRFERQPEEIARLEVQVQRKLIGRIRDLHLSVDDDGLILRGRTRSYYVKQLAQHEVMQVSRLPIQANEIEVLRT
jgi:hypothetical protein